MVLQLTDAIIGCKRLIEDNNKKKREERKGKKNKKDAGCIVCDMSGKFEEINRKKR